MNFKEALKLLREGKKVISKRNTGIYKVWWLDTDANGLIICMDRPWNPSPGHLLVCLDDNWEIVDDDQPN